MLLVPQRRGTTLTQQLHQSVHTLELLKLRQKDEQALRPLLGHSRFRVAHKLALELLCAHGIVGRSLEIVKLLFIDRAVLEFDADLRTWVV